jgi:hypothetical protein
MMCPTHSCSKHGERRTVLGGCEECGAQLVPWDDPDRPTIEQLAQLVVSVAAFEGKLLPLEPVEQSLRANARLRGAWEQRHREALEH